MTPTNIWTDLGGSLTLVGATSIDRGTGIFRYAPDYEGPAIDPINLPVADAEYRTAANKGVFGVLSDRSEEHTSELQSLMRISYAVFCLKKKKNQNNETKDNVNTE